MNLTLRQFEILLSAADASSFSAAAQALGISQPSLSESIRRMERETGMTLFERTTRSLRLTDEGRQAAAIARELVRDFKRAVERLSASAGGKQGRIAIAALPSIVSAAMPQALKQFARDYAGIDVSLHDVQHERAMALLADGVVDIAVTIEPAKSEGFVFQSIAADVAHLVCRPDHALARRKTVRWRELADAEFVGITRISSVRRLTDAGFVHGEVAITPRYEVEQVPSAVALVEAGLGVTVLPSLTFAMFKGRDLLTRPLIEPTLRRNVGFVTRASRTLPSFSDVLMQAISVNVRRALGPASKRR